MPKKLFLEILWRFSARVSWYDTWEPWLNYLHQSVKYIITVTFQILHHLVTFDEKWENLPLLIIYKIIRSTNFFWTRYYENSYFKNLPTGQNLSPLLQTNNRLFFFFLQTNHVFGKFISPNNVTLLCNVVYGLVLPFPGVGTPILGHGWEVLRWWPPFLGFSIWLGPYFIPRHNPIDPLFLQEKISLSLSSLVPET